MSRATVLARGRTAAEAGMVDACTIQHQTGSATDQETGQVTPTYTTVYTGQCRFQVTAPAANETDVGEAQVYIQQTTLQLPMSVTGVAAEDLITCTSSALDPDLPGRTFRVKGVLRKTHATSRRIQLQEVD